MTVLVEKAIPFSTVAISLAAFLLSTFAFGRTRRDREKDLLDNSVKARQQYNSELRSWTNDSIEALSEACLWIRTGSSQERLAQTSARLSCLVDQGRLFFPNPATKGKTSDDDSAYRDFRPRILDWLIYAYKACNLKHGMDDPEVGEVLRLMQRGFVSDAQLAIDPWNLSSTLSDLQTHLTGGNCTFMDTTQQHNSIVRAKKLLERPTIENQRSRTIS